MLYLVKLSFHKNKLVETQVFSPLSGLSVISILIYYCFTIDIYISLVSYTHQVAAKGWFIALVSTTVETNNPEAEILPGLNILGPIKQK